MSYGHAELNLQLDHVTRDAEKARREGKPRDANPYDSESQRTFWRRWDSAWRDASEPRNLTINNQVGPVVERRQVGYYPDNHDRFPGSKQDWVILCTVKGARGPIKETRIVTYGDWETTP